MKRNILSLLIALFATMQVAAQTYDNLWKQAEINAQKAQPKSEIAVMKKIIAKASAAKDYGQLLAAEIRQMTLWKEISADSLTPNVKRMEAEVLKVNDPALKAVRYAVLGKVYRDMNRSIEAIPTWALCYIINGDASGLTDEEIRMVDEAMRKNNIEIVSPRYNEDMCTEPYFSHYPFFGLPTEVEDCDIIYHE